MPLPHFTTLYRDYANVLALMRATFSSHQFILRLAQRNQSAYIECLYQYRNEPDPFRCVHRVLSQRLNSFTQVSQLPRASSPDIFGDDCECAEWTK